jgi:uncharacterized protein (TIGR02001 family)
MIVARPSARLLLATALPAVLAAAAPPARAQWSASVSAMSDYRFRGVSLSDHKPDLRAGIAYDGRAGWYGGAALTRVELGPEGARAQLLGYAGLSRRWSADWAWDAGITATHFVADADYDYAELYAGVLGRNLQARVYASPTYFGRHSRSLYAELDAQWPLSRWWSAQAHAGRLAASGRGQRSDWRVGLRRGFDAAQVQLDWSSAGHGGPYPAAYDGRRSGWTFSVSYFF